jgi:hypothetical protein
LHAIDVGFVAVGSVGYDVSGEGAEHNRACEHLEAGGCCQHVALVALEVDWPEACHAQLALQRQQQSNCA